MIGKKELTQERLKELLAYDPDTGAFTRKVGARPDGKVGTLCRVGYFKASVDGREYYLHRLAILYMTGAMPAPGLHVDHMDGDKTNNKFCNLRIVSHRVNLQNRKTSFNTVGRTSKFLGVSRRCDGKKWIAQIANPSGKKIRIGSTYESEEAAHEAYIAAKRLLHEGNML